MSVDEKIAALTETQNALIEDLRKAEEAGNTKLIGEIQSSLNATKEYLSTLEDYKAYMRLIEKEDNDFKIEEAMLAARTNNGYLMDLNQEQLKQLGATGIYKVLADELGDSL